MCLPPPALLLLFIAQDHASPVAQLSAKEQKRVVASSRRKMCEAIVAEMHIEILKHNLKKDGEDDVYETVPAICLGVVQNYTFSSGDAGPLLSWSRLFASAETSRGVAVLGAPKV